MNHGGDRGVFLPLHRREIQRGVGAEEDPVRTDLLDLQAVKIQGKAVKGQGTAVKGQGQAVKIKDKTVDGQGKEVGRSKRDLPDRVFDQPGVDRRRRGGVDIDIPARPPELQVRLQQFVQNTQADVLIFPGREERSEERQETRDKTSVAPVLCSSDGSDLVSRVAGALAGCHVPGVAEVGQHQRDVLRRPPGAPNQHIDLSALHERV